MLGEDRGCSADSTGRGSTLHEASALRASAGPRVVRGYHAQRENPQYPFARVLARMLLQRKCMST
jgi:hypothetical protein